MRLLAAAVGAAATFVSAAVLRDRGEPRRWLRTNFRGTEVDLRGGLASAAGALAAGLAVGGPAGAGAGVVVGTGAVLGAFDDADTDSTSKGLGGHVRALGRGEVTTGMLKLVGISTAAVVAGALVSDAGRRGQDRGAAARGLEVVSTGVLIAATANLTNLFDLRPGRALKLVGALSLVTAPAPGPAGSLAAGALGTVVVSWQGDLTERTMLGDAGANALGALAGTALAALPSRVVRTVALALAVALVLASERVSFSRVIAQTPALAAADAWGRRG